MRAWKWIVLGVVGVGTMAGGIVALVFWLTSGAVDAAENFLTLVGQGQYETAYRATAPNFRASNDFATFRTTMQRVRLDKFDSASWSSRHVRNNRAGVRGTAKLADGAQVPIYITMIRHEGGWAVTGIRVGAPATRAGDDDN